MYARYELDQSPFYNLKRKKDLFKLLRTSSSGIKRVKEANVLYADASVNGREIEKPRDDLKRLQKRIEDLLKRNKIPDFIHGPAKGKSYITNASVHVGASEIRCLDIASYFQSTSSKKVFSFFESRLHCSKDVAGILCMLTTHKGRLPTGSPSSPLISYFAHIEMWESIDVLVKSYNCTLSVYIDDVTISGAKVPGTLKDKVKKVLNRYGLRSKKSKEKYYRQGCPAEVTGIIVGADKPLSVPRRQHKKMHEARNCISFTDDEYEGYSLARRLQGYEAQKAQVEKFLVSASYKSVDR
ncbi:MAG: reverse transcriptase family protein [Bacteroidota bacterium]